MDTVDMGVGASISRLGGLNGWHRHPSIQQASRFRVLASALLLLAVNCGHALDIPGPPGSVRFGTKVSVLPNGNFVVTDPDANSGAGAAHLYSPAGSLISTLTGSLPSDRVAGDGVIVLANGNYLILSLSWTNGLESRAGAVTWASGTQGVSGQVSAGNSLVGTAFHDSAGLRVTTLSNGNYVVSSESWDNGAVVNAGAVTWCNGMTGASGVISAGRSLVGTTVNDRVGAVTALSNGNYVVRSRTWDNGTIVNAGAVTWGDGTKGTTGSVSASNSLVGTRANDEVGHSVSALSNGNYVVASPYWSNGEKNAIGAVTWVNGASGISDEVSPSNSLVGSAMNDLVGSGGTTALTNGHYVVSSPQWSNGDTPAAGAVTWADGTTASSGFVSVGNSLVGTTSSDAYANSVTALSQGNYVVRSPYWNNRDIQYAGAVTWRNGSSSSSGTISPGNSLVGTTAGDRVGLGGIVALDNGHYVVRSQNWNSPAESTGAVTWGDGSIGVSGPVSAVNSLVGTAPNDSVGSVTALQNGHYVVHSPAWNNGFAISAGAVTWGNGSLGTTGPVSTGNSFFGTRAFEQVGMTATALSNGAYVVRSRIGYGENFSGAVTWRNGSAGTSGTVSTGNSLFSATGAVEVGGGGVFASSNGNYMVASPTWTDGTVQMSGAITLIRGNAPFAGVIDASNSVLGTALLGGNSMVHGYDAPRDQLVVGRPQDNIVTIFRLDALLRTGFD